MNVRRLIEIHTARANTLVQQFEYWLAQYEAYGDDLSKEMLITHQSMCRKQRDKLNELGIKSNPIFAATGTLPSKTV